MRVSFCNLRNLRLPRTGPRTPRPSTASMPQVQGEARHDRTRSPQRRPVCPACEAALGVVAQLQGVAPPGPTAVAVLGREAAALDGLAVVALRERRGRRRRGAQAVLGGGRRRRGALSGPRRWWLHSDHARAVARVRRSDRGGLRLCAREAHAAVKGPAKLLLFFPSRLSNLPLSQAFATCYTTKLVKKALCLKTGVVARSNLLDVKGYKMISLKIRGVL